MTAKTSLALAALALAIAPLSTVRADNDVKDFIDRLKGSVQNQPRTNFPNDNSRGDDSDRRTNQNSRGEYDNYLGTQTTNTRDSSNSRSQAPTRGNDSSQTRKMSFASDASVPTALRRAASDERVELFSSSRGGVELTYSVDSASKISRDDILFRQGSTEFADQYSYEIVRDLAYAMQDRQLRGMQFVIEGHASAEGSYDSNLRLSQRRADRIVSEMIRLGVNRHALIAVGYGESEARYDANSSERLRANDRKVVVYRMD